MYRPECVQTVTAIGWSSSEVVEAKIFVWQRMDDGMSKHQAARNALRLAGPKYDGERCWHHLEINHGMLEHGVEADIREKLRVFEPLSREEQSK